MLELAKALKLPESVSDIFEDIGVGICGLQTLTNDEMLITTKKKCKNYIAKTPIPKIIDDLLTPLLAEIRLEKEWHNEKEFFSESYGVKITLIKWCNDDGCIIKYGNGKETSVGKSYFRGLYNSRNELPQKPKLEQIKITF